LIGINGWGCNADETRYFRDATRADTKRHERKRHEGGRAAAFSAEDRVCAKDTGVGALNAAAEPDLARQ
jgi:hypothetical protein